MLKRKRSRLYKIEFIINRYVEISANSPLGFLAEVETADFKNIPLILLSSEDQRETEHNFYANDLGFRQSCCTGEIRTERPPATRSECKENAEMIITYCQQGIL